MNWFLFYNSYKHDLFFVQFKCWMVSIWEDVFTYMWTMNMTCDDAILRPVKLTKYATLYSIFVMVIIGEKHGFCIA